MDKRSLLAFILIAVLISAWLIYTSVNAPEINPDRIAAEQQDSSEIASDSYDSIAESPAETIAVDQSDSLQTLNPDSLNAIRMYGDMFAPHSMGEEKHIVVENDLLKATISNKGAVLLQWELKDYTQWEGYPTQLIWNDGGELFLEFQSRDNRDIDTRNMFFKFGTDQEYIKISGEDSLTLTATMEIEPGKFIKKNFTFYGNKYHIGHDIKISNMESLIRLTGYKLRWTDGLRYQEKRSDLESQEAVALVAINGQEPEELDATDTEIEGMSPSGLIDYAAVKIKYFGAVVIPQPHHSFDGIVDLQGSTQHVRNNGIVERYDMTFRLPYKGGVQTQSFKVFIGPLEYDIVEEYGLESTINFGWFIFGYIGEYMLRPLFNMIHLFISNYGITIIFFSLIIKFLLYPLSIQQMRSAQKMKLLQPEMQKLRDQYKDDNKTQQAETMKLYSKYGINPASGCFPLLLQMPILFALWKFLNTSIELRQADFWLWINDLSLPDYVVELPFSLFGITHLSGLALLMGVTLFIQQKQTITDPRQKGLVYIMPVMFTLLFSNLPSGLNLYYFIFNLLGIMQQVYINKFSKNALTLADLAKSPKKEGWLQKKMREAQEIANSQGKTVPGQPYDKSKTKYQRKKKKK